VATSITAFVGYTASGRDNFATRLFSFPDFERNFGGLASDSELSYAVQQFFLNGGSDAYVVRVPRHNAVEGEIAIEDTPGGSQVLLVTALSAGNGAKNVIVDVDYDGIAVAETQSFNLTVTDLTTGTIESFPGVTIDSTGRNFVATAVNDDTTGSKLVRVSVPPGTTTRPAESGTVGGDINLASLGNANNFTLNVSGSLSATGAFGPVLVPFINAGETIPASIIDVCRLLERRANAALQKLAPNARITLRCTPSSSGIGIRVRAFVPADVAGQALDTEITFTAGAPHNVAATLQLTSATVNVAHYVLAGATAAGSQVILTAANAGVGLPQTGDLIGDELAATGVYALSKIDLFNILCIPDATRSLPGNPSLPDTTVDTNAIYDEAEAYCQLRRAFLLIDPPPNVNDVSSGYAWKSAALTVHDDNAAAYFPRLKLPDPLNSFHLRTFAPCGVIAGLYARIDAARGVWKAPAGVEAVLQNVSGCGLQAHRPGERRAQPDRAQLPARVPDLRPGRVGRSHAGRLGRRGQRVEVRAGAADGAFPGGKPLPRHQVGRVRAERRAALVADSPQPDVVHDVAVPPGRLPGDQALGRLLRQVRQQHDHPGRYQPGHRQHPGRLRAAQAGRVRRD